MPVGVPGGRPGDTLGPLWRRFGDAGHVNHSWGGGVAHTGKCVSNVRTTSDARSATQRKPGETPREATTNCDKGGVQKMLVEHCKNVELVYRWKMQKHVQSHTNRDECQGSATNADSCEEQQKVIHDSRSDHK